MTLFNSRCSMCGVELLTGDIDGMCISCKNAGFGKFEPTYYAPWICPRCQIVYAPWVGQCNCPPPTITTSGTQIKIDFP